MARQPVFKREKHRVAAYQQVFGTVTGKQVLQDLYDRYGRVMAGDTDSRTFMLIGQNLMIQEILDVLNIHPLDMEELNGGPGDWYPEF